MFNQALVNIKNYQSGSLNKINICDWDPSEGKLKFTQLSFVS